METTDSQGVADEAELCPSSRALLEASSTNMTLYYMYKFYPCGNDAHTERSDGIVGILAEHRWKHLVQIGQLLPVRTIGSEN